MKSKVITWPHTDVIRKWTVSPWNGPVHSCIEQEPFEPEKKKLLALNHCSDKITWFQCLLWATSAITEHMLGSQRQQLAVINYTLMLVSIHNGHVFLIYPKCWILVHKFTKAPWSYILHRIRQVSISTELPPTYVTQYNYMDFTPWCDVTTNT
jgi:hypothetical protein